MLYYFYTSIAGIALAVHLIINWRQLVDWRELKSRPGALEFRHFLFSQVFFFVSDILWGIFAELKCPRLLYADTLLFFLTMALSIYAWTRFIVAYMELDGAPRGRVLWTGRGMLAFFCAALVVNGFTGSFFVFTGSIRFFLHGCIPGGLLHGRVPGGFLHGCIPGGFLHGCAFNGLRRGAGRSRIYEFPWFQH